MDGTIVKRGRPGDKHHMGRCLSVTYATTTSFNVSDLAFPDLQWFRLYNNHTRDIMPRRRPKNEASIHTYMYIVMYIVCTASLCLNIYTVYMFYYQRAVWVVSW